MVWFGALVAVTMQTAYLSPPVAMSAYYLKQVVKEWSLAHHLQGHVRVHGAAVHRHRRRDVRAGHRHLPARAAAGRAARDDRPRTSTTAPTAWRRTRSRPGRNSRRRRSSRTTAWKRTRCQSEEVAVFCYKSRWRSISMPRSNGPAPGARAGSAMRGATSSRCGSPTPISARRRRCSTALAARVAHGVFGYTTAPPDARARRSCERLERRHALARRALLDRLLSGRRPGPAPRARASSCRPTATRWCHGRSTSTSSAPPSSRRAASPSAARPRPRALGVRPAGSDGRTPTRFFLCNPQNPGGTVFRRAGARAARRGERRRDHRVRRDPLRPGARPGAAPRADREPFARGLAPHGHADVGEQGLQFPCRRLRLGDHRGRPAAATRSPPTSRRTCCLRLRCSATTATLAALRGGDAWLAAQLEYLRGNRDLVERDARRCRWRTSRRPISPGSTARRWEPRVPTSYFLQHGVALSPGPQFGGSAGFVRLNFATQRARLAEALARMRAAAARPAPR